MNETNDSNRNFIPALRFRKLTPLFDIFLGLLMKERAFRNDLVSLMPIKDSSTILDFGCGTGSLLLCGSLRHPAAHFIGVDIDPEIIAIARKKIELAKRDIPLVHYDGDRLPFADQTFDIVMTSLVFHHLGDRKIAALREMLRVLKTGGALFIADFGIPLTPYARLVTAMLGRTEPLEDNLAGRIPALMVESGFTQLETRTTFGTLMGTLAVYTGTKPE